MQLHSVEEDDAAEPRATMFEKMRAASIPIQQFLRLFAFKPGKTNYLARFTQEMMRAIREKEGQVERQLRQLTSLGD